MTFVYVDSTKGWKTVNDGNSTAGTLLQQFCNSNRWYSYYITLEILKFTHLQVQVLFCVSSVGNPAGSNTDDYLVIAGGGSGGGGDHGVRGGGGGAGGFRESSCRCTSGCYTQDHH